MVLVGLLINIASAYLKPLLDRTLSRSSKWWATRTEEKREIRAAQLAEIRASEKALLMMLARENRHRHKSTLFLFLGLAYFTVWLILKEPAAKDANEILFISLKTFFYLLSMLCGFIGISHFFSAQNASELIDASQGGRS